MVSGKLACTNVTAEQHARSANAAKDVGLRERSGADRVNQIHIDIYL